MSAQPKPSAPSTTTPLLRIFGDVAWLYGHVTLNGFCRYLPLLLISLVLAGLLTGKIGSSMGVQFLFFHDHPFQAILAGVFTAGVAFCVLCVGYLLRSRDRLNDPAERSEPHTPTGAWCPEHVRPLYDFSCYAVVVVCGLSLTVLVSAYSFEAISSAVAPPPAASDRCEPSVVNHGKLFFLCGLVLGSVGVLALVPLSGFIWKRAHARWGAVARGSIGAAKNAEGNRPTQIRFQTLCFVLSTSSVILLAVGLVNPNGKLSNHIIAATVGALVAIGSWAAFRHGGARGFFFFLVAQLFAAHFVVTWVAHLFGSWIVGGACAVALSVFFVVSVRRGYPKAVQAFETGSRQLPATFAGPVWIAVALVTMALFLYAFVTDGWAPNPAALCLVFVQMVLLVYAVFAYFVPKGLTVSVIIAAGLLAILGGVQPYKYRIDALSDSKPSPDSQWSLNYEHPLDLEEQLKCDRANQWKINDLAKKNSPELAARYRELDSKQRLIPLKAFDGSGPSLVATFPERALTDPGLLNPGDLKCQWADRQPLVVIAVSGGALRAAAWTHAILSALEREVDFGNDVRFSDHVRLIAGASGGMFGATQYVVGLSAPCDRNNREKQLCDEYTNLTQDCLTPLARQMVFSDLPNLFSPWPQRYDRGLALEEAWQRKNLMRARDHRPATFGDLRTGEVEGWRPSLVISPMIVEDGRRLLFSNLDLRWVVSNDGPVLRNKDPHFVPDWEPRQNFSREAFEFFRMFPDELDHLPVSRAVRLSATFPIFSPAASLPTKPRLRVVDAGYYDNYGVSLASAWLFSTAHAKWIKDHASKVLLIQIRAYETDHQRTLGRAESTKPVFPHTDTLLGRAVEDVTTPIVGLTKARESAASFRNDEQLELLAGYLPNKLCCDFAVINFELSIDENELPLTWYLTPKMTERIKFEADRSVCATKDRLSDWWKKYSTK